eukprot:364491-Chlamydomonas_euryale.AAC.2
MPSAYALSRCRRLTLRAGGAVGHEKRDAGWERSWRLTLQAGGALGREEKRAVNEGFGAACCVRKLCAGP